MGRSSLLRFETCGIASASQRSIHRLENRGERKDPLEVVGAQLDLELVHAEVGVFMQRCRELGRLTSQLPLFGRLIGS
jgi:hypothetical protein